MKANYQNDGLLIVVSGPSGVGKGTVCAALREKKTDLTYSVSATTRQPREGEEHGVNYFFETETSFKKMIQNEELIEWAQYVGNYYGTPRRFVEDTLRSGKDVLLEIDVQGAQQVKQRFSNGIFIFLLPPSIDDLRERIVGRGSETEASIHNRLGAATDEFKHVQYYDYVVINDRVEAACERIDAIITAEHCKKDRIVMMNG
ncbi:guanylate kinase [Hazenella sp. IB182357]|uniref:Guanylate kinase n=1 Tax=Polycladospora coralii TaxID=2771432 RepID=A0A926RSK3_9BACL|nr:guanylate kinase [Polycladospora coralii]MBD1371370.1 guanylate kinase [Polycladospora coralii]MBS7530338.1 guanylate kinase [Polycladospora coralii]